MPAAHSSTLSLERAFPLQFHVLSFLRSVGFSKTVCSDSLGSGSCVFNFWNLNISLSTKPDSYK